MFFKKKKEKTTKKIDKLVTGLIIWGAVASMVGLSQTKKWKEITQKTKEKSKWFFKKANKFIWKIVLKTISITKKK